jgi:4'-phosphopantetheinyl transferase
MTTFETFPAIAPPIGLSTEAGGVDLWHWFYEAHPQALDRAAAGPLMSPEESARHRRFRFDRDRRLYLATRVLARHVLSRYEDISPAEWRFAAGSHGKPRVESPALEVPLHFNLSNTSGLVVCAVSRAHEAVGVDIERTDRPAEFDRLAARFFSHEEAEGLARLPEASKRGRFFELWTLKESYIKARGLGLALPLEQFTFSPGAAIRVAFDPRLNDDPARWSFALISAGRDHQLALSARTDGAPLRLRISAFEP